MNNEEQIYKKLLLGEVIEDKKISDLNKKGTINFLSFWSKKDDKVEKLKFDFDFENKLQELTERRIDYKLKISMSSFLKKLLIIQYFSLLILIIFQGFKVGFIYQNSFVKSFQKEGFNLDNYIFYLLVSGVLAETYFLVRIVVQHFFPKKDCGNENEEHKK